MLRPCYSVVTCESPPGPPSAAERAALAAVTDASEALSAALGGPDDDSHVTAE